ncbi:MAG: hypothetical protein ACD_65C00376G0010 [uncultured bacterium]|nr:MAG: hypothetical protein ACD_65C00376G0010 [uncultured bacterium]
MRNNEPLEDRVQTLEERVKLLEEMFSVSSTPIIVQESMKIKLVSEKEYLIEKKPTDDVQRTFYLGRYLEEHKKMESFTVDDIRMAFKGARVPVPSNINDKINKNIAKGYFMESDPKEGKKSWMLTSTGEQAASSNMESK